MSEKNILFIIPINDGESVEIHKLLFSHRIPFMTTSQKWGASWDGLEESIKDKINSNDFIKIYGIELQGKPLSKECINIDHHKYSGDDRSNELSSLEQVAEILEVELSDYQKAVSLNDKGYIPLMKANNVPEDVIQLVRLQDRIAQGITAEQEEQAEIACREREEREKLTIVKCPHSKTACICDRLYGQYENLLIISSDGEVNFFGEGKICEDLYEKVEGSWCGGQLPVEGYWGGYPSMEFINNYFIDKEKDNEK